MHPVKLMLFVFVAFVSWIDASQAQSPRQQLRPMVEQLQKTPTDNALRERIIKLGVVIKPAPAIPEEADLAFLKGNAFQKEAKDALGYELAISAYRDALRHAPWWADAYYNLSVAQESVGKLDEAVASMKFYLFAALPGADTVAARTRISALEVKKDSAKTRSFEGYWRYEAFQDFDSKQWINKNPIADNTNTLVWSIRKDRGGSYIVNSPQYDDDPYYQSVVATEQTIEWWAPSLDPTEDCSSSSCGVKMKCRRTDEQGMECLFQGIGFKDDQGSTFSSMMRLRRFDRCVQIGGEKEGRLALRCE